MMVLLCIVKLVKIKLERNYNSLYNEELLIKNGYKKYKPSPIDNECITDLYQKRFDDDIGKKYFITINRWNSECTTQLYQKDTHNVLDISFHKDWELKDVEFYIEKLFNTGKFDYYERWN